MHLLFVTHLVRGTTYSISAFNDLNTFFWARVSVPGVSSLKNDRGYRYGSTRPLELCTHPRALTLLRHNPSFSFVR